MLLNLLNGDCALAGFRVSGLPGDVLVWRENYLHGVLPATEDRRMFCQIRAHALHTMAQEKSEASILSELWTQEDRLSALMEQDTLLLWFDVCPFDCSMLARILYLLNKRDRLPALFLVRKDVVWDADSFVRHALGRIPLTCAQLSAGARQWEFFRESEGKIIPSFDFLP